MRYQAELDTLHRKTKALPFIASCAAKMLKMTPRNTGIMLKYCTTILIFQVKSIKTQPAGETNLYEWRKP